MSRSVFGALSSSVAEEQGGPLLFSCAPGPAHQWMPEGSGHVAAAYGGQAVMEGVMMRGPAGMAVAVRLPDGRIRLDTLARPLPGTRSRCWRLPVLRGLAALADSMALGTRALLFSAEVAAGDGTTDPSPTVSVASAGSGMGWTLVPSLAVAIGLFVVLPAMAAGRLRSMLPSAFAAGLVEGLIRLVLLLGYVAAMGMVRDMRRVLEFHGAEHKAIAALEAGLPLMPGSAASQSRFHPRCGTSFLLFVVLLAGFGFSLLGWEALWLRVVLRLALLPLLAGVGYEVLRATARAVGGWASWLCAPGLWLQRLTTREPHPGQLEVALAALEQAMAMAGDHTPQARAERPARAAGDGALAGA